MDSFLAGAVCGRCNNGWMSRLESTAKPLILDLAGGRKRAVDLTNEEATVVAKWALKTAYALHTSSNWRRVVPDSHIFQLDADTLSLPDRVFVVAHTYKGSRDCSWSQMTTWQGFSATYAVSDTEKAELKRDAYKIGIRVGGLFLAVFRVIHENAKPCLWPKRHVPLYPLVHTPVAWQDADRAWPSDPLKRFYMFLLTLSVYFVPPNQAPGTPERGHIEN
jgi:hypothetical protein